MVIKNKFNALVEKLSLKTFKMNAVIFAVLWTAYIVASYYFTLYFGMRGWSVIATMPLSILFYAAVCLAVLVGLLLYRISSKSLSITFYPKIFIYFLLIPQAIYVLANPFRDCGDYSCPFAPNMLAALLEGIPLIYPVVISASVLIAVFSIITYVAGVKILYTKIFTSNISSQTDTQLEPSRKKIKSGILFGAIFIPILAAIIFFVVAQGGWTASLLAYTFCPNERAEAEKSICAWPTKQCWAIIDGNDRNLCYFSNTLDKAIEKQDISICEKSIKDTNKKDICYGMIANMTKDWSICDRITTQAPKCNCYSKMAFAKKDPSLCEQCNGNQGGTLTYENCYYDIAKAKQDSSICDMIQNPESRCFCYSRFAEDEKNPALCEQCNCEGEGCAFHRKYCYFHIATGKNDPAICGLVPEPGQIDECYEYVARWADNPSVCDLIKDQNTKKSCYRKANLR